MTFGSLSFVLFASGVLIASAAVGRDRRWIVLLAASCAFYAAASSASGMAVLVGVTVASWGCALGVERHAHTPRGSLFFRGGVLAVIAALVATKYAEFLLETGAALVGFVARRPHVSPLPAVAAAGLSYYALQAIAYLIDVRDGAVPAERNLGRHALALAFFPKVIQGPIERAEALLPQLRQPRPMTAVELAAGARLFVWGLFQKKVVADRLAPFVETVFSDVPHHAGLPLLVATYLYAAQLYFDFAGYTDMALGLGRALGIRLTPNFASPYLARSIPEFWRRWHISLSSWLLDYVFKPLQLDWRDWRTWGTPAALVVTFLVSGLWHGAAWTFVAWGLLHGIYLGASVLYRPWQRTAHRALRLDGSHLLAAAQVALTFHLVCVGWIFFRARSLGDALDTVRLVVVALPATVARAASGRDLDALVFLGQGRGAFVAAVAAVVVGGAFRALLARAEAAAPDRPARAYARTAVCALLLYGVAVLGSAAQSFLYAQY